MSNSLQLKDFERWKSLNRDNDFCFYDYIFHEMKNKNINTDVYFAFAELFWPTFIKFNNLFFLREQFSEEKMKDLEDNKSDVEYWLNFLTVDSYFDDDPDGDEKAAALSQMLVQMWDAKLKQDFPDTNFTVKYLHDEEMGDYGLTFYQE